MFFVDLHYSTILLVFGFVGLCMSFTTAVFVDGEMGTKHFFPGASVREWGLLLVVGMLSFVCQVAQTKALQFAMAATVSLERRAFDVIFAFLFQILIFSVSVLRI